MKKVKVFCFPYAGGSSVIYNQLKQVLDDVEVVPVEYAGRGRRFKEELYESVEDAVEDIFTTLEKDLEEQPYVFLGYSFGALVAYELTKKIIKEEKRLPVHIFFMACHAPHRRYGNYNFHQLSDGELAETLLNIGGINKSIYENQQLLDVFIPIIKNDFKIYETYDTQQSKIKIPVDISIAVASRDKLIPVKDAEDWAEYAGRNYKVAVVDGDHFFIHEELGAITNIIRETLQFIEIPVL